VDFNYGSQIVFADLNFDMEKGEFVFLIGKSGSGKSTLLQLIYMNIFPLSGTVQVDQFNSKTIKPKELPFLRRKLGIVFQDFKLLSDRNIYENLEFVLKSTGVQRKKLKKE
jgi:cell division transport system ATP-binding protein